MKFNELPFYWKRVYELAWKSLCNGSRAIAAVIVSDDGEIISEGRSKLNETTMPNPLVAHAETEAISNLDTKKYPNSWSYTLYTSLEPCPMCMGTIVMGHVRKVVIGAKDDLGGAMELLYHSKYTRSKNIKVTWEDKELGDIQRALQTISTMLFMKPTKEKLTNILNDFCVYNKKGVDAALELLDEKYLTRENIADKTIEEVFDKLMSKL